VKLAEISNDNRYTTGYWQIANGAAYWRIYNDATNTYMEMGYGNGNNAVGLRYKISANASATMKAICCTVKSESGYSLRELPGITFGVDNGTTAVTAGATLVPVISLRSKELFQTYENLILAVPKTFSVSTNNPIKLEIRYGGTLTSASWTDVNTTKSSVEYDVSATAIAGGDVVYSEYITGETKNAAVSAGGILGKTVLWDRKSSHTGIFTICAVRTSTSSGDVLSSINWEEIR